jgi:hypothetical protein
METTKSGWTILDRKSGVLTRSYEFAKNATARTFAARMPDGKMLVVSPTKGLTDEAADELRAFGDVGAIVANNGLHHLGHPEWRERFPDAPHFAPEAAMARIAKKNPRVGELLPLSELRPLLGDDLGIREMTNTRCGESWCWAKIANGYAWYTSDVLANLPELPRSLPGRLLFWGTRSGPGYRVFHLALMGVVKDKKATLLALLGDIESHPVAVVVPGHGSLVAHDDADAATHALITSAL